MYKLILAMCCVAVPLSAQTSEVKISGPVTVAPVVTPATTGLSSIYMLGLSYNHGATPAVAGTGLYAHQVGTSGTYAFTMTDAVPSTVKPYTITTDVAVGIAQKIMTIGKVPIIVPTAAGISYTGSNVGWSWSGGFGALFRVKNNWYMMPTFRFLKSSVSNGTGYQPNFGILLGFGK